MKPSTMNEIIQAVQRARKKHPHFADNRFHAVSLAAEELGEFAKAVNEDNRSQAGTMKSLETYTKTPKFWRRYSRRMRAVADLAR